MTDSQTKYDDRLQEQLARANFLLFIGVIVLVTGLLILANDARWWRQTGVWSDASLSYLLGYYEIDLKPLSWESAERALEQILGLPVWWFLMSAGALTVVAGWSRRAQAKSAFRRLNEWRQAERLARESTDPL
jgi:hypothetical protein